MVLILSITAGCAATGGGKKFPSKAPKQKIEHEKAPDTGARKEIIRNEPKPPEIGSTPKARAAAGVLESGRKELAAGNNEKAEDLFQQAINIDPANGIAYYYLARAKYELGQYQQAMGVLDKAEGLLQGSSAWMEAIETLRGMIRSGGL